MIIDDLGMADDQISWVIPWINGPILWSTSGFDAGLRQVAIQKLSPQEAC